MARYTDAEIAAIGHLYGRVSNAKYWAAADAIDKCPADIKKEWSEIIKAIARMVGSPGWGLEGDLGTIISAALQPFYAEMEALEKTLQAEKETENHGAQA